MSDTTYKKDLNLLIWQLIKSNKIFKIDSFPTATAEYIKSDFIIFLLARQANKISKHSTLPLIFNRSNLIISFVCHLFWLSEIFLTEIKGPRIQNSQTFPPRSVCYTTNIDYHYSVIYWRFSFVSCLANARGFDDNFHVDVLNMIWRLKLTYRIWLSDFPPAAARLLLPVTLHKKCTFLIVSDNRLICLHLHLQSERNISQECVWLIKSHSVLAS